MVNLAPIEHYKFMIRDSISFFLHLIFCFVYIQPGSVAASFSYSSTSRREGRTRINAVTSISPISHELLRDKNILVVGGSGRVGGSVVTQLLLHGAKVTVGGTNEENFQSSRERWYQLFPALDNVKKVQFLKVEREDAASFTSLSSDSFDLCVNTAGPFQGKVNTPNGVLEACVEASVPYIDVCDDYCTAMAAKKNFGKLANVPCIISTGCWPGVSSLMAKQLTRKALIEYPGTKPEDLDVKFSFFTAGSGGAGATLLVATFLILAEKALTVVKGRRMEVQPMLEYESINFGDRIGIKDVAPLNLLETASIHDNLGIGNTKSLFGTAPEFWNTLLGLMAQLPSELLSNESLMEKLAVFSLPIVRVVDYFAGATNAMRCDVSCKINPGLSFSALYGHENLEPCVGECVVAFCAAIFSGNVPVGINFPEEAVEAGEILASVLKLSAIGAHTLEANGQNLSKEDVWG